MVTLLYLLGYDRQSLKVSFSKYSFVLFFLKYVHATPHYKKKSEADTEFVRRRRLRGGGGLFRQGHS